MRKFIIPLVSLLLIFSFLFTVSCSLTLEEKIDKLFKPYSSTKSPGASLIVIKNSIPVLIKSYGMAIVEDGIQVTPETNFRLASFTKQFTAMSLMLLEQQGKLAFGQTLKDIFPDFPEYGSKITLDHIIHHTSGLIDYESLIPDSATRQVLDKDVLKMMMEQDSTYFPPGTEYKYSNSGYAVLAMVVEKISGVSFARFLKNNIFQPLDMNTTLAYENGISEVQNRAFGYAEKDGKLIPKDQSVTSAVLGDGGIYSNVNDLFKWDQALYSEKLISKKAMEIIFRPQLLEDSTSTGYGFGWRIDEYKGFHRVHHTGQTCGFTTIIQRFPKNQFTIIILTNRNKPMLNKIAESIADLFLLEIKSL